MVRSLTRTVALIGRARREYTEQVEKAGTVGLWLLIGLLLLYGVVDARQYLVTGIIPQPKENGPMLPPPTRAARAT